MNTMLFCDLTDTSIPTLLNLLSYPTVSLASIFVGRKEENPKYKQLMLNLFFSAGKCYLQAPQISVNSVKANVGRSTMHAR